MIQTFLLSSLPPPGEGGMGPTGQARAPDGWDPVFADVLLNFLFERDDENPEDLAGAAGVLPMASGIPLSFDTAFPVIETPDESVALAAAETGPAPVEVEANGTPAVEAFSPVDLESAAAAGVQVPVEATVDQATSEAAAPVVKADLPNQQLDHSAAIGTEPVTGSADTARTQPAQTLSSEPFVRVQPEVEPVEEPAPESKAGLPAAAEPVETTVDAGKVERNEADRSEVAVRGKTAVTEAAPAQAAESASPTVPVGKEERPLSAPSAVDISDPAVQDRPVDPVTARVESSSGAPAQPVSSQPPGHMPESMLVGERAAQAVEAKDQGVLMQMVRTIQTSVQQGQSSMRLQLNPQELGSIDVRLVSNPQGVGVTVYADQASTGRLLEMQIDQLRTALQDAGVQIAHLNVFQQSQQRHEAPADWSRKLHGRKQPPYAQQAQQPAQAVEGLRLEQSVVDYRV